jgi:hypothetical protein
MNEKEQNSKKAVVIGKQKFRLLSSSKLEAKKSSKIDSRLSTAYLEARRKVSGDGKA